MVNPAARVSRGMRSHSHAGAEIHQLYLIRTFLGIAEAIENSKHARKQSASGGGGVPISLTMGYAGNSGSSRSLAREEARARDVAALHDQLRGLEIREQKLREDLLSADRSSVATLQKQLENVAQQRAATKQQYASLRQVVDKEHAARLAAEAQSVQQHMQVLVPSANPLAIDLLAKVCCRSHARTHTRARSHTLVCARLTWLQLLTFKPEDRMTVDEALKHRYLADLHDPNDEPDSQPIDPALFEFERRALSKQELGGVWLFYCRCVLPALIIVAAIIYQEIMQYYPEDDQQYPDEDMTMFVQHPRSHRKSKRRHQRRSSR